MSDVAIRVEGLSKAYQIRHSQARSNYRTLRDDLVALAQKPLRRGANAQTRETFWALDDVSFEVRHGEALGIIGRNGAGKSTLLKILSRITKPTKGMATVYGRVGSLLEVGTGFHPELTGRENIYLNGAILGMTRRDIARHFDEIVAFAEVEQFLDTPVKRYSSGMYMRLAFAVAAHLEPEVLVVDEVLAVGDAAFQKKCLGKMGEVAQGGRTVLFVSHNMGAVKHLTKRTLWLNNGQINRLGRTETVIADYFSSMAASSSGLVQFARKQHTPAQIMSIRLIMNEETVPSVPMGSPLTFQVEVLFASNLTNPHIGIGINHPEAGRVVSLGTRLVGCEFPDQPFQRGVFECYIDSLPLNQGTYSATLVLADGAHDVERIENAMTFQVALADVFSTGSSLTQGLLFVPHRFHFHAVDRIETV
jgi:lipopolysaccharide transport system ATP-binding protein